MCVCVYLYISPYLCLLSRGYILLEAPASSGSCWLRCVAKPVKYILVEYTPYRMCNGFFLNQTRWYCQCWAWIWQCRNMHEFVCIKIRIHLTFLQNARWIHVRQLNLLVWLFYILRNILRNWLLWLFHYMCVFVNEI